MQCTSGSGDRLGNQSRILRDDNVLAQMLVERYGKCLPNVTAMSQRLVIMTNSHMIRLAQYSTVSWRLVFA
jgi:hypothetical protein